MFADNLRRLRGKRTQAEIAEAADIPLRSYQHAESGIIPQGPNRTAIARALGAAGETELFLDPDLRGLSPAVELFEMLPTLDDFEAKELLAHAKTLKATRTPKGSKTADDAQTGHITKNSRKS